MRQSDRTPEPYMERSAAKGRWMTPDGSVNRLNVYSVTKPGSGDRKDKQKEKEAEAALQVTDWIFKTAELRLNPLRPRHLDFYKETLLRMDGGAMIKRLSQAMEIDLDTAVHASVYLQRYYQRNPVPDDRTELHQVSTACMFLAGKVTENRRSLESVVAWATNSNPKKNPKFVVWQEGVQKAEQKLLASLCFDLTYMHIYTKIKSFITQEDVIFYRFGDPLEASLPKQYCLVLEEHHESPDMCYNQIVQGKLKLVDTPSFTEVRNAANFSNLQNLQDPKEKSELIQRIKYLIAVFIADSLQSYVYLQFKPVDIAAGALLWALLQMKLRMRLENPGTDDLAASEKWPEAFGSSYKAAIGMANTFADFWLSLRNRNILEGKEDKHTWRIYPTIRQQSYTYSGYGTMFGRPKDASHGVRTPSVRR